MTSQIVLTNAERFELTRRSRRLVKAAVDARRARLILLLADGMSWDDIVDRLGCSRGFIATWRNRFVEQRMAGLRSRHLGQVSRVLTPALEARILNCKLHPPGGALRSTSRSVAEQLHISHMTVARVWRTHGQKARRLGPATGAVDILALYLDPSAHAAVFGVLEEAPVNARGDKTRNGSGDLAPGIKSLYDAFTSRQAATRAKSSEPHSAARFEAFLADIVVNQRNSKELHVIVDNFADDENKQARKFLSAQQKVRLHSMPTCASWLKQVELWISRIVRIDFDGQEFTPAMSFRRKLMDQVRRHNSSRLTLRWNAAVRTHHAQPMSGG